MPMLKHDLTLTGSAGSGCHSVNSSRYEQLVIESVWIDNITLERDKLKQLAFVRVNYFLNRSSLQTPFSSLYQSQSKLTY